MIHGTLIVVFQTFFISVNCKRNDLPSNGAFRIPKSMSQSYCGSITKMYGITKGFPVGDFFLDECLGAGDEGEAWSVQQPDGKPPLIARLLRSASDQRVEDLKRACEFGHWAKQVDPVHFTDCFMVDMVAVNDSVQLPVSVIERAQGRELESVLRESPAEIKTLSAALNVALEIFTLMNNLMQPDDKGVVHYHQDLHPSNLFITDNGQLTAIDYGETTTCCKVRDTCAEVTRACDDIPSQDEVSSKPMGQSAHLYWFLRTTFLLFIEFPAPINGHFPVPKLKFLNSGDMTQFKNAIRSEYRQDFELVETLASSLLTEFSVCIEALKNDVADIWPPRTFLDVLHQMIAKLSHEL